MGARERVGLEPGDVDDGLVGGERHQPAQAPLGAQVGRPALWSRDVVLAPPRPALGRPPLAPLVAATRDERQPRAVGDRRASDPVVGHDGAVARALVVVREAVVGGADRALAALDLDQLEPRVLRVGRTRAAVGGHGLEALQPGELQRLQHRLVVLVLVADDQLGDQPIADALALEHRDGTLADGVEVLPRRRGPQERQLAAARSRRLERVVDLGQVAAEHRLAAEAMDEPQVLERGDVPEVPDERAHQRRVDALEVLVADVGDECQRALARLGQRLDRVGGGQRSGHPS